MKWLRWFIAGALAVPLFHQSVLAILHATKWVERGAFAMTPTQPFGIPQVISLSFWGGVWGLLLGLLMDRVNSARDWLLALVFGMIAPTLVAGLVVAPLKGQHITTDGHMIITGLLINGAWGLGTAVVYKALTALMGERESQATEA